MLHDIELEQMRMIAEQASPGPYTSEYDSQDLQHPYKVLDIEGNVVAYFPTMDKVNQNQRYWGTFHPDKIIRLLTALDEEKKKVALLVKSIPHEQSDP